MSPSEESSASRPSEARRAAQASEPLVSIAERENLTTLVLRTAWLAVVGVVVLGLIVVWLNSS